MNELETRLDGTAWDVVVIGGGAAGLSAALTLGRVRRSVLVIDAEEPRNAPAVGVGVHGVLSRDGTSPLELLRLGREEVAAYGGQVVSGRVTRVHRAGGEFSVVTEDRRVRARRVLVTTGLVDELPDVPGLAARWGRDVLHCVYCHGWEVRDRAIGVLGSFHQALLFRQLSKDVTLFQHEGSELTKEQLEQLAGLGIGVVEGQVDGLVVDEERDRLTGVRLVSGVVVPVQELVVAPRFVARAGFLGGLGLTVQEHPMGIGEQVVVDGSGFTGVAGVWAAGNVSDVLAGVPQAMAAGVGAAAAINTNLLMVDAGRAADRRSAVTGADVFGGASAGRP